MDAIVARAPGSVLDVGCGEGWLVRALSSRGIRAVGVDVVAELVERARESGVGEFLSGSYEDVAAGLLHETFDVVVCNFALFGDESVSRLLRAIPSVLAPGGSMIIQTLHPVAACGDAAYADGWRQGSWAGCGAGFEDAPPWFFRTMDSWMRLFEASGLELAETREPLYPGREDPASVLFVLQVRE